MLSAHFVPQSEALSDASNRSVSENDSRRFTDVMGARAKWIGEVFNQDEDLQTLGITLTFKPEQHSSMSVSETTMAETFSKLLAGMTPEAAGYVAGIIAEDFPDDIQARGIFKTAVPVTPATQQPPALMEEEEPMRTETKAQRSELDQWRVKALKALAKGDRARMVEFVSKHEMPPVVHDLLAAMLEDATSEKEVKAVFKLVQNA